MTEWLHFHFSLSCIGGGNGNPFQYSCLENPRDGGAWWAAVYGVAQSRTRQKRLSSSSSSSSSLMYHCVLWNLVSISGFLLTNESSFRFMTHTHAFFTDKFGHILLLLLLSRFSHVQLCATSWTAAHQTPLSMGSSRQEYWSRVPLPSLNSPLRANN